MVMKTSNSFEKRYILFKTQYNKARDVINSVETFDQWNSAKRMLNNLSNWWVSERPLVKPFSYKKSSEPVSRIAELERLLTKKLNDLCLLRNKKQESPPTSVVG